VELPIDGNISQLAGRVIKSNGEIIVLKKENFIISKVTSGKRYNDELYRLASIIYPNVQVGDVLDLVFDVDFDGYVYSETMYLAQELATLHSKISIRNNSSLDLSAFPINGMPELVATSDKIGPLFLTEQRNIKAIPDGDFNALRPTIPKLVFNLWMPEEALTHDVVYSFYDRNNRNKFAPIIKFYTALLNDKVFTQEDYNQNQFLAVIKTMNYLQETMTFDNDIYLKPDDKLDAYYYAKKIDGKIYMKLLEQLFLDLAIPYDDCRTNSLWAGQFDVGVVALDQFRKRFFIIQDQNGADHFIFEPNSKGRWFKLDEIPYNYEGNKAVAWKGKDGKLSNVSVINLPESSETETQQVTNIQLNITTKLPYKTAGLRQDKFSGHYSAIVRGKDKSDLRNDLCFSDKETAPNSVSEVFPYQTEFRTEIRDSALITDVDESLKMLDLSKYFPNSVFYEDEKDETYSGYLLLPFRKSQQFRFFVLCNSPVQIEEKTDLVKIENTVGSCSYDVDQMSENSFKIICTLTLKKRILETEQDAKDYMEIINFFHTMKGKKWVLSL
jgi:hypothetical protein